MYRKLFFKEKSFYWIFSVFAFFTILKIFSINNSLFWDTIQFAGQHANYFYFNGISKNFFLPNEMNSGHFPLLGLYSAILWDVFGRTLIVSHLSMLPFIYIIIIFWYKIGTVIEIKKINYFLVLLIIHPIFLGHSILISPDIILISFFLIALYGYLSNKTIYNYIGIIGLGLTSNRGICLAISLHFYIILENLTLNKKNINIKIIKQWIPFILMYIILGLYFYFHYLEKGWVFYHKDMPWADSFYSKPNYIKNLIIFLWRLVDMGNIFLWLTVYFGIYKFGLSYIQKRILLLLSIVIFFYFILMMPYSSLMMHRYFLPIYLILNLLSYTYIIKFYNYFKSKLVILIIFILLFSGNFWIYPSPISIGWDVNILHFPYYKLRKTAFEHLEKNHIPYDSVASAFPNVKLFKDTDLNNSNIQFATFKKNKKYILKSNVMNDMNKFKISRNYHLIKKWKSGFVYFELWKRN